MSEHCFFMSGIHVYSFSNALVSLARLEVVAV